MLLKPRTASFWDIASLVFLGFLTLLLLVVAWLSLRWPAQDNAAIMRYLAFLLTRGYVPYTGIFDINLPGTYFIYWLQLKLTGFSDSAFRFFDLAWLAATLLATYYILRDFSRRAAYAAAILTGLYYLGQGPPLSLERDFLLLLPLALAILAALQLKTSWRAVGIGFWIGAASLIKPPAALAILAFLPEYQSASPTRPGSRILGLFLGFSILPTLALLWLLWSGALTGFWAIFTNYLPLYLDLSGDLTILLGKNRFLYVLDQLYNLYPLGILFAPAALGAYLHWRQEETAPRVYLFLGLLLYFIIYVIVQGKFWPAHWLPVAYLVIMLGALCFREDLPQPAFISLLVILIFLLYLYPLKNILLASQSLPLNAENEIGAFLKAKSQPGDKVQPIGWMGQAQSGLLAARSLPATPYIYTLEFYHHVSSPVTRTLQADFIRKLVNAPPRFIVQSFEAGPHGADTRPDFPLLDNLRQNNYLPVKLGRTYTIWQRG